MKNGVMIFSLSAIAFSLSSMFFWYKNFDKHSQPNMSTNRNVNVVLQNPQKEEQKVLPSVKIASVDNSKKEDENKEEIKNTLSKPKIKEDRKASEKSHPERNSKTDKVEDKDKEKNKVKDKDKEKINKAEDRKNEKIDKDSIKIKNNITQNESATSTNKQGQTQNIEKDNDDIDTKNLSVVCVAGEKCRLYYNLREYNIGDNFNGYKVKEIFIDEVLLEKDGKIKKINIK